MEKHSRWAGRIQYVGYQDMSHDMLFPTMWKFDKCILRRACVENANDVQTIA